MQNNLKRYQSRTPLSDVVPAVGADSSVLLKALLFILDVSNPLSESDQYDICSLNRSF